MCGRCVTFDTVYTTPCYRCMLTASVYFQEDSVLYMRKNPNTIRHSGCKKEKTVLRLSLCCFMSSCEVSCGLMGLIIFVDEFGLK